MFDRKSLTILVSTLVALLALVFLGVRHYGGNVSALLHMDVPFGQLHQVPEGLVLYKDAAYDGMLYYQVARDIPALIAGQKTSLDSPYRFQRILLPLFVYGLTLGNDRWFPIVLLIVNLAAAIGTLALTFSITKRWSIHTIAVVANPAVLVGILFSLTEPLSVFFVTLFFFLWLKQGQKLTMLSLGALMLSLLARETTIFLIGLLFLWLVFHKQWRQAVLITIPLLLFVLWQYFLVLRLGSVAFQANSNIVSFPIGGPLTLLWRLMDGFTTYRLSSLGLLLFVTPLSIVLIREWMSQKKLIGFWGFLLSGLCATMLMMDAHIWGAITSIGRVVAPIYPVYALYASFRDTWVTRALSYILITVSIVAALGIASVKHPFMIS